MKTQKAVVVRFGDSLPRGAFQDGWRLNGGDLYLIVDPFETLCECGNGCEKCAPVANPLSPDVELVNDAGEITHYSRSLYEEAQRKIAALTEERDTLAESWSKIAEQERNTVYRLTCELDGVKSNLSTAQALLEEAKRDAKDGWNTCSICGSSYEECKSGDECARMKIKNLEHEAETKHAKLVEVADKLRAEQALHDSAKTIVRDVRSASVTVGALSTNEAVHLSNALWAAQEGNTAAVMEIHTRLRAHRQDLEDTLTKTHAEVERLTKELDAAVVAKGEDTEAIKTRAYSDGMMAAGYGKPNRYEAALVALEEAVDQSLDDLEFVTGSPDLDPTTKASLEAIHSFLDQACADANKAILPPESTPPSAPGKIESATGEIRKMLEKIAAETPKGIPIL